MYYPAKIFACLFSAALCSKAGFCQYKLNRPITITLDHGLPSTDIRSIKQGNEGFMWIGTTEGLCRFDGQEIRVFENKPDPQKGPYDNLIQTVLPVNNEIWMGTSQGISVLRLADESFRHYQLTDKGKSDTLFRRFDQGVNIMCLDKQGDIWIGTRDRGAWIYDRKKDDFRNFPYAPETYPEIIPVLAPRTSVLSIEASRTNDSIIWVGTTAGLEQINKYTGQVKWFTFPSQDKRLQVAQNAVRRMYSHTDGLLYIGSWEAGMNVFNPFTKTFSPLPVDKDDREVMKYPIGAIVRKNEDEIWITSTNGLVEYNIREKKIKEVKYNNTKRNEFYGVYYVDKSNRIWSTGDGLQYFDPVVQQFNNYSFDHLYPDDWTFVSIIKSDPAGNKITVCPIFTEGIYRFDKRILQWERIPFRNIASITDDPLIIRGFESTGEGEYLISSDKGLFTYSERTQLLKKSSIDPPVQFKRWGELKKDRSGNFWISADVDGLVKWNGKTGGYRIYKKELDGNSSDGQVGRAANFFEDSHGNIWFSRLNGFSVHLLERDTILNFLYTKNSHNSFPVVNSFAEDKIGRIWVSSSLGSYGYIDIKEPQLGIQKKFDLQSIGINESLVRLGTDKQGNIWGFTSKNLIRLNAASGHLWVFDFAYGVKVVDFINFVFLPSGEMVFGGRTGITLANPAGFRRNVEMPTPYITELKVLNQPVAPGLYNSNGIWLAPKQNFFSVSFSAIGYTLPAGIKFRYRLRGFDDWVETSERRFANYTNVTPGDYLFQLQVANNEGIWNQKMIELPVYISTPWWQTWWFRIGALVFIGGVVYWFYRYRISQVKKKEQLKSQYEKRLANVEMSALLAQMNPHFLFNSLNSIDSYIIKNESKKASEYLNNFARLMRLILQNSRSNYISLKDELEALHLYLQMEELRFASRFEYEIKVDPAIDTASTMIPPMLMQPYVENAIWHGLMQKKDGRTGKVEIRISKEKESLQCVIEDNGIGRDKAQALREQKTGNHKRSMGMQITKDRIEMINKLYNTDTRMQIVDLKDPEGNASGTRVELLIPV